VDDDQRQGFSIEAAEARTELGRQRYREVMVSEPPPPIDPFLANGVVDAVFGELWDRPGLSRRIGGGSPWRVWHRPTPGSPRRHPGRAA
jgi:hypothetical protein